MISNGGQRQTDNWHNSSITKIWMRFCFSIVDAGMGKSENETNREFSSFRVVSNMNCMLKVAGTGDDWLLGSFLLIFVFLKRYKKVGGWQNNDRLLFINGLGIVFFFFVASGSLGNGFNPTTWKIELVKHWVNGKKRKKRHEQHVHHQIWKTLRKLGSTLRLMGVVESERGGTMEWVNYLILPRCRAAETNWRCWRFLIIRWESFHFGKSENITIFIKEHWDTERKSYVRK